MDKQKPVKQIRWTSLDDCPCFICQSIKICGAGHTVNPIQCKELEIWIVQQIKNLETKNPKESTS